MRRACGTALVIALVAGCASPADRRAALEKEAETTLASSAWIVSRARALHDQGAATSPYVRVVARQNADDVRTLAKRLEKAGATEFAGRARELTAKFEAVAAGRDGG